MMIPNELLWLIVALIDFSALLIAFRAFGKDGLYVAITISIILCNIQVLKIVNMFGVTATLGNILYGSIFLATNILNECYGKKEAKKGVWVGFYAMVVATIIMKLTLIFTPAPDDFIDPALRQIFDFLPRVAAASIIAYIISQLHNVWIYRIMMIKTDQKYLWFRNNASTMLSQFIDTLIFCTLAFWGVYSVHILIEIIITTCIFKWLIAILDTPFIYLAKRIAVKHNLN